jgi:RecA-family ATPase
MRVLEVALSYAARGWPVFPLNGKTPAVPKERGGNGRDDATTDPVKVRDFWKRYPRANVGIATGRESGLLVVDVDDGADGMAELAKLGPLPKTLEVITGSGNRQLFFVRPAGEKWGNTARRIPHIDTRGDGGYVAAPPSIHPETRKPYSFVDPHAPIAPLPQVIIDAIYKAKEKRVPPPRPPVVAGVAPLYARRALEDECDRVARAGEGQRNDELNRAAFSLGQLAAAGLLAEGDVERELWNAAMSAGLDEGETHKTIASGLEAGKQQPRQVQPRTMPAPARPRLVAPATEPEQQEPDAWEQALQQARDDLAVAGAGGAHEKVRRRFFQGGSASELFAKEFGATPWVVRGLVTEQSVYVVSGEPKTTKTWGALEIGMSIATGTRAFGEFPVVGDPRQVFMFLVEDPERSTRNRLRALAASRGMDPVEATKRVFVENLVSLDLCDAEDLAYVVASVRAHGPAGAVVLDPLRDLHTKEEDDSGEMAEVMGALRALRAVLQCAVIFVHHSHKSSKDNGSRRGGQRMRGSSAIHGAIDGGLHLYDLSGNLETEWANKAQGELKAARSAGLFTLKLVVEDDDGGEAVRAEWIYSRGQPTQEAESDPQEQARRLREAVVRALSEAQTPLTQDEIAAVIRKRKTDVSCACRDLMNDRRIKHGRDGYYVGQHSSSHEFREPAGAGSQPVFPPPPKGGREPGTRPGNSGTRELADDTADDVFGERGSDE